MIWLVDILQLLVLHKTPQERINNEVQYVLIKTFFDIGIFISTCMY